MTRGEYAERLARAHEELQALGAEHVDFAKGMMGQDTHLTEIDALRDASQQLWDEDPLFATWKSTYRELSIDDVLRSVFSAGVVIGWRASKDTTA